MIKKIVITVISVMVVVSAPSVYAGTLKYDFKDPKDVNSIGISSNAGLELIRGVATGISGTVGFDPEHPATITGRVAVATDKIAMANTRMTKALLSEDWLDAGKHPEISYELTAVVSVKKRRGNAYDMVVSGDFTCKGITQRIQVPVHVRHLPGRLHDRNHKGKGDLLALQARFAIDRHAFGIQPGNWPSVVAREIYLDVGIVGAAATE